jgi:hypothetical protein
MWTRQTIIVRAFLFWNYSNLQFCSALFPSAPKARTLGSTATWSNWREWLFNPYEFLVKEGEKEKFLELCREPNVRRLKIEYAMQFLESPIQATAASPLLQKTWRLEWTSEKEINFFLKRGICPPNSIYQVIDGTVLENCIPFKNGGSFGVTGELSIPDVTGKRTDFVFTEATLDLGRWGVYRIPPKGKGWFETIYLDDTLRIDINSRNDILICTAV